MTFRFNVKKSLESLRTLRTLANEVSGREEKKDLSHTEFTGNTEMEASNK